MTEKIKKPWRPTRACPHRWCRPLHVYFAALGLVMIATLLVREPIQLLYLLLLVPVTFTLRARINRRSVQDEILNTDNMPSPIELHVDRFWARVAVGVDILYVVASTFAITVYILAPGPVEHHHDGGSNAISLAVGVGLSVFEVYAHRRATRPRRPKRAWGWLFGAQGSEA